MGRRAVRGISITPRLWPSFRTVRFGLTLTSAKWVRRAAARTIAIAIATRAAVEISRPKWAFAVCRTAGALRARWMAFVGVGAVLVAPFGVVGHAWGSVA